MKINLLFLVLYLLSPLAYGQQGQARREIPASWIAKVQKYDYKTTANDLVREFQTYIAPDSLAKFREEAFLSPMFVNLDEDIEVEVLILFDNNFVILKNIENKWFVIYKEDKRLNSLTIINTPKSPSKIICLEDSRMNETRTIIAPNLYHFYRILEDKVYLCGSFIRESVYNYSQDTQWIDTKFDLINNYISIQYHYRLFYDMPIKQKNNNILPTEIRLLFEGISFGIYTWNEQEKKFLPQFDKDFTPQTLEWLEGKNMGNVFFQKELERIKTAGTKEQKRTLKQYLKVHQNK